jgi:Family of unknown function (DUF6151)
MNHPIRCSCGALQGTVAVTRDVNRCICYCRDCQAFAHFLQRSGDVLDAQGGTDITQTNPKNIRFTQGIEHLACMRLSEKGLLRWYSNCCNTPIGNTLPNFKLSFIGLIHTCLASDATALDSSFGPVRARVNTEHAKGKVAASGVPAAIFRLLRLLIQARLSGSYKQTPFFAVDSGAPIVVPKVLSAEERKAVRIAVASDR